MNTTLVCYDDDNQPHRFYCVNGYVSRCVSAVFDVNHPDAERLAKILNEHFAANTLSSIENARDGG